MKAAYYASQARRSSLFTEFFNVFLLYDGKYQKYIYFVSSTSPIGRVFLLVN